MNGMLNWLIKMLLDRSHKHCKNHSSGPILFIWKPGMPRGLILLCLRSTCILFPFSKMPHMHIYITNICADSQINLHRHHHKYSLKVLLENPKIPSQSTTKKETNL